MSEEDLRTCQQCAQLRDSLEPCEGGCGREICSYCGPKCKDCVDQELYDRFREEEEEEKRQKREAKKPKWEPERTFSEKVGRAMDWVFGFADGALKRELERWPGEFDDYEFDDVQEMMRSRWRGLPESTKSIYRAKKKAETLAAKTAYKAITTGGRMIGKIGRPMTEKEIEWEKGKDEDFLHEPGPTCEELDELYHSDEEEDDEDWNDDEQDTEKDIVDEEDEEDEDDNEKEED